MKEYVVSAPSVVHCQRMTELNERYNSCRAKTAECVAAAVKRKEDVSHPVRVCL